MYCTTTLSDLEYDRGTFVSTALRMRQLAFLLSQINSTYLVRLIDVRPSQLTQSHSNQGPLKKLLLKYTNKTRLWPHPP
jgi:hypothetical protein